MRWLKWAVRSFDATCPYVQKIHKLAAAYAKDSIILIAGDPSHPEVQGIEGFCERHLTFKNADELKNLYPFLEKNRNKAFVLLSQTTFSVSEWEKSVEKLKKVCTNLRIFDTICIATERRQREAGKLAAENDAMVVVGGRRSSNTVKLAQICGEFAKLFSRIGKGIV